MDDRSLILICSGFLFIIALLGLLKEKSILKMLVSLELMVISAILNFCFFSGIGVVGFGYIAAISSAIVGGVIFCIVFSIFCVHLKTNSIKDELLEENDDI